MMIKKMAILIEPPMVLRLLQMNMGSHSLQSKNLSVTDEKGDQVKNDAASHEFETTAEERWQ